MERLKLLVQNSQCFFMVTQAGEIIGFARVVTNNDSFASLWDVVVDKHYQNHGIGTALVVAVFSDDTLSKITHWILYTNTAKKLYEKFGFVSETDIPNRKLVHKLRLQEFTPTYMEELIQTAALGLSVHLDENQSFQFLFNKTYKRAELPSFWKKIPRLEEEQSCIQGDKIIVNS